MKKLTMLAIILCAQTIIFAMEQSYIWQPYVGKVFNIPVHDPDMNSAQKGSDPEMTVKVENEEYKIKKSCLERSPVIKSMLEDKVNKDEPIPLIHVTQKAWNSGIQQFLEETPCYLAKDPVGVTNAAYCLELNELFKSSCEGITSHVKYSMHEEFKTKPKLFDGYNQLLPLITKQLLPTFVKPILLESYDNLSKHYSDIFWSSDLKSWITIEHPLKNGEQGVTFVSHTHEAEEWISAKETIDKIICSSDAKKIAYIQTIIESYLQPSYNSGAHYLTVYGPFRSLTLVNDQNDMYRIVLFNKASTRLVSCTSLGIIELWDTRSQEELESGDYALKALGSHQHSCRVTCMAVNADGTMLAVGDENKFVTIYDISQGITECKEIMKLPVYKDEPTVMELSPDGNILVVCAGTEVTFWDLQTRKAVHTLKEDWRITEMKFSDDGKKFMYLYAQSEPYKGVRFFHIDHKEVKRLAFNTFGATKEPQHIRSIMFGPNDTAVFVCKKNDKLCTEVWKWDFSEYSFLQGIIIAYAQKQKDGYVAIASLPEHMQKIYESFTDTQKKQLKNIFTS
jgi:hypothetical protein